MSVPLSVEWSSLIHLITPSCILQTLVVPPARPSAFYGCYLVTASSANGAGRQATHARIETCLGATLAGVSEGASVRGEYELLLGTDGEPGSAITRGNSLG